MVKQFGRLARVAAHRWAATFKGVQVHDRHWMNQAPRRLWKSPYERIPRAGFATTMTTRG